MNIFYINNNNDNDGHIYIELQEVNKKYCKCNHYYFVYNINFFYDVLMIYFL